MTSPNVTISSAVLASSCTPGLIKPVQLMEKDQNGKLRAFVGTQGPAHESDGPLEVVEMRDGSFEADVPVQAMGSCLNCQFNIVSQVQPNIIPFFLNSKGAIGRPLRWPWREFRGSFL